jgi:hypothetical protein
MDENALAAAGLLSRRSKCRFWHRALMMAMALRIETLEWVDRIIAG